MNITFGIRFCFFAVKIFIVLLQTDRHVRVNGKFSKDIKILKKKKEKKRKIVNFLSKQKFFTIFFTKIIIILNIK